MCGVVRVADRLANPATARDVVAVGRGPLVDLAELLGVSTFWGAAGGGAAGAVAGLACGGDVVGERFAG